MREHAPNARTRASLIPLMVVACGGALVVVACGGSQKVAAPTSNDAPTSVSALESDASASSSTPPPPKSGPTPGLTRIPMPLCGCALCKPVVSEDACTTDADCAAATPCHAEACVAKAKAVPPNPGTTCTAIMRCETADANTCGCLEGRCALYPKKK